MEVINRKIKSVLLIQIILVTIDVIYFSILMFGKHSKFISDLSWNSIVILIWLAISFVIFKWGKTVNKNYKNSTGKKNKLITVFSFIILLSIILSLLIIGLVIYLFRNFM